MIDLLRRWVGAWRRGGNPLGDCGEHEAARWLAARGYRVLHRNLRVGKDEADLVMLDPDGRTVVIVEVKTRRDDDVRPEENVHGRKRHRLNRLAAVLARRREYRDRPFRFDVIAIVWPEGGAPNVTHFLGAFASDL
ncbi:MAG: YraN family protein [Phycisphaeraceae bacterium]|nr:YraN family protein [Phycisphaerales bacterium]QOJ18808.1 MAG: YraN family protein [Phycisphaeraceae bacterium]